VKEGTPIHEIASASLVADRIGCPCFRWAAIVGSRPGGVKGGAASRTCYRSRFGAPNPGGRHELSVVGHDPQRHPSFRTRNFPLDRRRHADLHGPAACRDDRKIWKPPTSSLSARRTSRAGRSTPASRRASGSPAPKRVRTQSIRYPTGYIQDLDVDVLEHLKIVDYGDAAIRREVFDRPTVDNILRAQAAVERRSNHALDGPAPCPS